MNNDLNNIFNILQMTKQQTQQLNKSINVLSHENIDIRFQINRIKKLSNQSLDLFSEMSKQLNLLNNRFNIEESNKRRKR